jgi:RNase P/RNase MRP subunit p29
MNVIVERVTVVGPSDPSKRGRSGVVVLETEKTLLIDSGGRTVRIEKRGTVFRLTASGRVISGSDIAGRLQDRWEGRSR